jgi:hypothetical protein
LCPKVESTNQTAALQHSGTLAFLPFSPNVKSWTYLDTFPVIRESDLLFPFTPLYAEKNVQVCHKDYLGTTQSTCKAFLNTLFAYM